MSALSKFEQFMQQAVEGSVARIFNTQIQPAEIAKRLERAMESNQQIGPRRIIVPGRYRCYLHPEDFAAFQPIKNEIEREMAVYLTDLASERKFSLSEHANVELVAEANVAKRAIQVEALLGQASQATGMMSTQVIGAQGRQSGSGRGAHFIVPGADGPQFVPIESTQVDLGRGLGNDIILEDTRVSRHHAQIRYKNRRFWVSDMGSTNGVFVNGQRVNEAPLRSGDVVSLGGCELQFHED